MEDGDDSQRNLNQQENGDDNDKHQRGAIRVAQFATLALLLVLFEEFIAFLLRSPKGPEEEDVEHH